ncbi:MAG: hypothetical protein AAGC79_13820 [Pseudomonadota bacterium]
MSGTSFPGTLQEVQTTIDIIGAEFESLGAFWTMESTTASNGIVTERWTDQTDVLRWKLQTDLPDGQRDVKSWDFVVNAYREDGTRSLTFTQFDNGSANAVLYDETGAVTSRTNFRDDKVVISLFDETGMITSKLIGFADGREREITYDENGVKREVLTYDVIELGPPPDLTGGSPPPPENSGSYDWTAKLERYDENGTRSLKATIFDDGDTDAFIFNDVGVRQERQLIDGAYDDDWIARRVLYDETGKFVERIDYSNADGIPDDFVLRDSFVELGQPPPMLEA